MPKEKTDSNQIRIHFQSNRVLRADESDCMLTIRGGDDFITIHWAMISAYDLKKRVIVLKNGCDLVTGIDKDKPRGFYEITGLKGVPREAIENGTIPCSPIWFDAVEKIEGCRPTKETQEQTIYHKAKSVRAGMLASGNYERF